MGLIPKVLSLVLLVGGFAMAGAMAGEPACDGPYKYRRPTPEELATVLRNHQAWQTSDGKLDDQWRANLCQAGLDGADLHGANLQEASLRGANLQKASLSGANLQEASLRGANLQEADLHGANLQEADLRGANLQKASLSGANLQEASLRGANLQEADLYGANLQEADLYGADLHGANLQKAELYGADLQEAIYEPKLGTLPNYSTLTHPANHLEALVFHNSPAALIALREAFKKGGMRTQERQLTYAIEHTKQLQAWNPSWYTTRKEDPRLWLEQLAGKGESLFSYMLFELPSHYGMAPGRALWGLLGLIPIFAVPYWMATKPANSRRGLWMIVPADRLTRGRGRERIVQIRLQIAKTWRGDLRDEFRLFRTCLYFSILSAFHLGWREFNVGTWITRMQPREYTLRATGWVRTVAGLQSLLSVYLLALWVLTYFGRPFE